MRNCLTQINLAIVQFNEIQEANANLQNFPRVPIEEMEIILLIPLAKVEEAPNPAQLHTEGSPRGGFPNISYRVVVWTKFSEIH